MSNLRYLKPTAISFVALFVSACASTEPALSVDAPPPPPPEGKNDATYDYTHTVLPKSHKAMARRMVVALVRFEEDRPLEDEQIPFGPTPDDEPAPAPDSMSVQVEVQTGGIQTNGPVTSAKPTSMGLRTRAMLKHELMESESFVVVERDRILDLLREQKFGQSGYVHPIGTPETGKLMGVQYLLDGSVGLNEDLTFKDTIRAPPDYRESDQSLFDKMFSSSPGATQKRLKALRERQKRWSQAQVTQETNPIGVHLNLYSAKTGELVVVAYGIGATSQLAVRDAVDELVDRCRDLTNPPTIVAIEGDRIVIDTGAVDHVEVGQKFRYATLGKPVYNSAGQRIGSLEDEGGELEVTSLQELMSITKVVREIAPPAIGCAVSPAP
jgi:hypothetical protein